MNPPNDYYYKQCKVSIEGTPFSSTVLDVDPSKVNQSAWKTTLAVETVNEDAQYLVRVTHTATFEGPKFPDPHTPTHQDDYCCTLTEVRIRSNEPDRNIQTGAARWGDWHPMDTSSQVAGRVATAAARGAYRTWVEGHAAGLSLGPGSLGGVRGL